MSVNSLGVQIQTNKMPNNVAVKPADLPYDRALYNSTSDAFVSSDDNAVNAGNNSKSKKGWNFGLLVLGLASAIATTGFIHEFIFTGMDLTLSHDKRKVFRNFTKDSAEFLGLSLLAALVIAVVLEVGRKKKETDE
ncbi:hypothetical protein IKA15_06055 [bacterium]|nr:hypothetical protein [bacterium]